jgi:hypothetical protein
MCGEMKYKDFTVVEKQFANQHLKNWSEASVHENRFEHWDVKGILPIISMEHELKFDVKARKRISRLDISFQDDYTWIEGTDIKGNPGWLKGKADYICFELQKHWLIVNRSILHTFINARLYENGYKEGKGIYEIYTRRNAKDKITLAIVDDLARLEGSKKLRKYL